MWLRALDASWRHFLEALNSLLCLTGAATFGTWARFSLRRVDLRRSAKFVVEETCESLLILLSWPTALFSANYPSRSDSILIPFFAGLLPGGALLIMVIVR